MALDSTSPADATALTARHERVRALAERVAEAVEAIPMPESFRDGERAARAITVADRMLIRLPEPNEHGEEAGWVTPARHRLRRFADQVFAVIEDLPMPKTFLDGERAGRCVLATEQMFTQLYAPPKPRKTTSEDSEATTIGLAPEYEPDETTAAITARLFEDVDHLTAVHAHKAGFYPDGSVCDPAASIDYDRLACPQEAPLMAKWLAVTTDPTVPPETGIDLVAQIMTARANASTRAQARSSGQWPDGKAFQESDPDAWAISKAFPAVVMHQPGPGRDEVRDKPGPEGFPWWMVKNPDTG
ncbi:MAG TPA: hypothetical protein VG839_07015 [Asticcacaulis sp.]|nr:hypothetical protein [Asticcacaulis sp.]